MRADLNRIRSSARIRVLHAKQRRLPRYSAQRQPSFILRSAADTGTSAGREESDSAICSPPMSGAGCVVRLTFAIRRKDHEETYSSRAALPCSIADIRASEI